MRAETNHPPVSRPRIATWRAMLSVTKVGITSANLMAAFAGLWVGSHGHPRLWMVVWTLFGTALVVAGGAALNNFVDRDIDHLMARTRSRAVVTGAVSPRAVLVLGVTLGCIGLGILALLVNLVSALCAFVGLVMYAYVYTVWLKRTTSLNTVLGGIAGAMPPLIGWTAGSGGRFGFAAWALFFTFFLWQPPHFLPLAMKRAEEYRAAGIPMLPVVRGFTETKWQIVRYTAAMVPMSLLLCVAHAENLLYFVVVSLLGAGFLALAIRGLSVKDDLAWAKRVFSYSLLYLTAICVSLVAGAI
ncbi:MAG: heme o synthase [Alicyclobacillus sp.]|nr:heme o synthase [Alicyclobacillus sp.]